MSVDQLKPFYSSEGAAPEFSENGRLRSSRLPRYEPPLAAHPPQRHRHQLGKLTLCKVQTRLLLALGILIRTHGSISLDINQRSLGQVQQEIALRAFILERRDLEPARLPVRRAAIRASNRITDDLVTRSSSLDLGLCAQPAGQDHLGDGARRRGAERAAVSAGSVAVSTSKTAVTTGSGAQGRTEGVEESRHDVIRVVLVA